MAKPPSWECCCCCTVHADYTANHIKKQKLCPGCITGMLERALAFEINYPPTWGSAKLHPTYFNHVVSAHFIQRFATRERGFVGTLRREIHEIVLMVTSYGACAGLTCLECGAALAHISSALARHCEARITEAKSVQDEEMKEALEGLEQGPHWQRCPNEACDRRMELGEACNHLICAFCLTSFCFVCGTRQDESSGHWRKGGCPRYNFPGDGNAGYDGASDDTSTQPSPVLRPRSPEGRGEGLRIPVARVIPIP
ncbi:hypothetical protein B0A55_06631 [Friedmanniomyces simplex]|uniref:IBR domain-containing protein n=1 Tax=Friedmanniomyces simplex TaxID=329884 RepID=A0A4U0XK27_9PEZI|nr:hypothetical protein B0A55_06631 [Friedmanniomyces simplex]